MSSTKNTIIVLVREDSEIKIEPRDLPYEVIKITYTGEREPTVILPPHFPRFDLDNTADKA